MTDVQNNIVKKRGNNQRYRALPKFGAGSRYGKEWTPVEDEYLQEQFGLIHNEVIARRLGRSVIGIRERASKLGLVSTQHFLTASDVADIFGMDIHTVQLWIKRGHLKARKNVSGRGLYKYWQIKHRDVEHFIKEHIELYDIGRIDRFTHSYYRNLAAKYTPKNHVPSIARAWTVHEDAFLLNHRTKLSQAELGKRLHRTKEAVHARLTWLRAQGRMVPYSAAWHTRLKNLSGSDTFTTPPSGSNNPRFGVETSLPTHLPTISAEAETETNKVKDDFELKSGQWTSEEDQYLKDNWGRLRTEIEQEDISVGKGRKRGSRITAKELAATLHRTELACLSRAYRLKITTSFPNKRVIE